MNIKAIIANGRDAVFAATESLKVSTTYTQSGATSYNAVTGAVTPDNTSITAEARVCSYIATERSPAAFRDGERRFIFKREELTGITPAMSDRITEGGRTWEVLGFIEDPAEAVWNIVCKRSQA